MFGRVYYRAISAFASPHLGMVCSRIGHTVLESGLLVHGSFFSSSVGLLDSAGRRMEG